MQVLVFSDEFEDSNRNFQGQKGDAKWTAVDMHYSSDYAEDQNYKPDRVSVKQGALQIEIAAVGSEGEATRLPAICALHGSCLQGSGEVKRGFLASATIMELQVVLVGCCCHSPARFHAACSNPELGSGYGPSAQGLHQRHAAGLEQVLLHW